MSVPTYQSETSNTGASTTSLACNVPAGTVDDDALIATVSTLHASTHTHTTPSGWTLIASEETTSSTRLRNSIYRRVASSEPASYSFDFSAAVEDALVTISRVAGIDTAAPIDAFGSTGDLSLSAPASPSVTTSVDDSLILAFVSHLISSTTDTVPAGMSSEFSLTSESGSTFRSSLARVDQPSAGASGAKSWTLSEARRANVFTIAVAPAAAPGDTIAITSPAVAQGYQRDGTDQAAIPIAGTFTGAPTAVEARFGGGAWTTIDAAPSGGAFSGTLTGQPAGEGALDVRFANDTGVADSVAVIRVGDVFCDFGQSNSLGGGRFTNGQAFTGGVGCSVFNESGAWSTLASNYKDPGESLFSALPLVASHIVGHTGVPAIFVCRSTGGTGLVSPNADWASGGGEFTAAMTAVANSGINGCTLIVLGQGERDAVNGIATAAYASAESAMLDAMQVAQPALSGVKMLTPSIGEVNAATTASISNIQTAKIFNWNNDSDILPGPTAHDQDFSDDAHWKTDAEAVILAGRYWRCIRAAAFGGSEDARGPRFGAATFENDTITLTLTGGVSPLANGTDTRGWEVNDGNGSRTITAATAGGLVVSLTCDQPLVGPVAVSYGRGDVAAGATTLDGGAIQPLPIESFVDRAVNPALTSAGSGVFAPAIAG